MIFSYYLWEINIKQEKVYAWTSDWLEKIKQETKHMLAEFAEKIKLKTNGILILGGSSSEILGVMLKLVLVALWDR